LTAEVDFVFIQPILALYIWDDARHHAASHVCLFFIGILERFYPDSPISNFNGEADASICIGKPQSIMFL
jgi:hypothetical protein